MEKSPVGGVGESGDPGGVVSSVMTRWWLALKGVAIAAVCGHLDCNQLNKGPELQRLYASSKAAKGQWVSETQCEGVDGKPACALSRRPQTEA